MPFDCCGPSMVFDSVLTFLLGAAITANVVVIGIQLRKWWKQ